MKTKSLADKALFLAVSIFIIATVLLLYFKNGQITILFKIIQLISATAIIGGVADWYGVVSIYGKPLGIKWKTEIVISKKKELITGISDFICDDVLSKNNIISKIDKMNIIDRIINKNDKNNGNLAVYFADFIVEVLWASTNSIEKNDILTYIDNILLLVIKKVSITTEIKKLINYIIENNYYVEFVDESVPEIRKIMEKDSFKIFIDDFVSEIISNYSHGHPLRSAFSSKLEKSFTSEIEKYISKILNEIESDENHILKEEIKKRLNDYIIKLDEIKTENEYDDILLDLVNNLKISESVYDELNKLKYSFGKDKFKQIISKLIENVINNSIGNQELKNKYNQYIINLIVNLVYKYHDQLKNIIESNLFAMNNEELVMFLRESTENELQSIRLNGMFFGTLFGIVIICIRLMLNII